MPSETPAFVYGLHTTVSKTPLTSSTPKTNNKQISSMALCGKRWQVSSLRHTHYKYSIISQKNTLGIDWKIKRNSSCTPAGWFIWHGVFPLCYEVFSWSTRVHQERRRYTWHKNTFPSEQRYPMFLAVCWVKPCTRTLWAPCMHKLNAGASCLCCVLESLLCSVIHEWQWFRLQILLWSK